MKRHAPSDLFEDVEWLLDCGVPPWRIAERVGIALESIRQTCRRNGRHDLLERLSVRVRA